MTRWISLALVTLLAATVLAAAAPSASALYEPEWMTEASMDRPLANAAVVLHDNGLVYLFGGANGSWSPTLGSASYDPESGDWTELAPIPASVMEPGAAVGADGRIYILSGYNATTWTHSSDVQIYDPETDSWSTGAPIPIAVWSPRAETGPDGRIYVMGGESGVTLTEIADVQVYDPVEDSWSSASPMPDASMHGASVSYGSSFFYFGGTGDYVFEYNVAYDYWNDYTSSVPLPSSMWGMAAAVGMDGFPYLFGGMLGGVSDTCYYLDFTTQEWVEGPSMPQPLYETRAVGLDDGRLLVLGGINDSFYASSEVYSLDVAEFSSSLSADEVGAGAAVMVTLSYDFAYLDPTEFWGQVTLVDGMGDTYALGDFDAAIGDTFSFEVNLPEGIALGEYALVVSSIYAYDGTLYYYSIEMPDVRFTLTVVDTVTLEERVAALEDALATQSADIATLQAMLDNITAQMDAMNSTMADQVAALQERIDALEASNAELSDSVDTKMESMLGYVIIVLVVIVLVLALMNMMMIRKGAPPPPAP
ncbi:MAG: hypothetical protein MUE55_07000 [Thermoplasmata archaeon]|nr:hypothetical protein [Thermoplasmata archaeon]